jgi:hypothetical protein
MMGFYKCYNKNCLGIDKKYLSNCKCTDEVEGCIGWVPSVWQLFCNWIKSKFSMDDYK